MPLSKTYEPKQTQEQWYRFWEDHGLFRATVNPQKQPYTIVIPPPNVTGVLHMGHMLNNTLQDVFIRFRRMMGFEACWIPGTDHAGIATQNVVERSLMKDGMSRHDLGREEFVRRTWEWRAKYGGVITEQLRKLGVSCDWDREKFTMDETLSGAVREVFVRLYEDGLIYKGKYVINWCPKDHTAISDDEVTFAETNGNLYHIRYPLKASQSSVTVATTRPETMLGDSGLAVHPGDDRYKNLIGQTAVLPLVGRELPIVADEYVDPAFGTGIVKVTPAHDPNDFAIGGRHKLEQINIFDISARVNDAAPEAYRGLDRFAARERVVQDLEEQGFLEKTEPHVHNVGRCYRCDTVIEPYLSDQWFVKMAPLAAPALDVVLKGHIRFHPDRWTKVYEHWMTNIRDWCISRQLWWGHRIPVWYCTNGESNKPECTRPIVSRTTPQHCPSCKSTALRQDEDVLDTWFSAWLWPFSVHDWPEQERTGKSADLRYFYPTSTLVTAPDIIFFWVARMIMSGLKFGPTFTGTSSPEKNIPFRDVYFTSIIRDEKGRKMSKSLGNSPEPLDLIEEYGADAVRFTILYLSPLGQDVFYSREKNDLGRNFANKIWNAGRFLLMNKDQIGEAPTQGGLNKDHMDLADRWIVSRYNSTVKDVVNGLDEFEVNKISKSIYGFLWHDFCDWYVEMVKSRLYGGEPEAVKQAVVSRAFDIFEGGLRLLHPLMPFVTEELWHNLRNRGPEESIMRAPLGVANESLIDLRVESEMSFVQQMIEAIRTIRGEMRLPPSTEIEVIMRKGSSQRSDGIHEYLGYLQRLARVRKLTVQESGPRPPQSASAIVEGEEIFIPLEGLIDPEVEKTRLSKEIERISGMLSGTRKKLENNGFLDRAPEEIVRKEREKMESLALTLEKLERNLKTLIS